MLSIQIQELKANLLFLGINECVPITIGNKNSAKIPLYLLKKFHF